MKSTGIVRKVDELGRVVLPIELRRVLDIGVRDAIEIFVEEEKIILKKYEPNMSCMVSGEISNDNLELAGGKLILSQESAQQLIDEIEHKMKTKKSLAQIV